MPSDDIEITVDNSDSKAPRGFPDFDKFQLDATKREMLSKMRVKMLDYNEEYLSKHPQVSYLYYLFHEGCP